MSDKRKVASKTNGRSGICPAAKPINTIRGLSIIRAKGLPNNNGVHAVPINETPDIATIGNAEGSIRLIKGRSIFLIKGGSIGLIKVEFT